MEFPKDFTKKQHEVISNATQWKLEKNNKVIISIVGGGIGLYGDGINTFEMWDYREDEPRGYLTRDEINIYLKDNPII